MKLYKWQKDCLARWQENGYRGIINVVTGAGKTTAALAAINLLGQTDPQLRVKVVVPTIPLANQWKQALLRHAETEEERPGFFGGGRRDNPDQKVLIYIINTARTVLSDHIRRDFALGRHVLLICDECHHYQSRENRKIFRFLQDDMDRSGHCHSHTPAEGLYSCLGLSATPFGTQDDAFLKKALGDEIFSFGFDEAVSQGIISPFSVCQVSVSFRTEELMEYAQLTDSIRILMARLLKAYPFLKGLPRKSFMKAVTRIANKADMDPGEPAASFLLATFQRKEISVLAKSRLHCCISLIRKLHPQDKILIFSERISQAEELSRMLCRRFGPVCGLYHSEMNTDSRARVVHDFREGTLRILSTCRCLDEGMDVPDANIGIVMSSSAVPRQRIQRLGRILRRSQEKQTACLYYLYIRESADEIAYLDGLKEENTFDLRYYSMEDDFSNDFYEYAARQLLDGLQKKQVTLNKEMMQELRTCIIEGLPRADYLLEEKQQEENRKNASSIRATHEKNYWLTMQQLGRIIRQQDS